jgi:hypothetical protein
MKCRKLHFFCLKESKRGEKEHQITTIPMSDHELVLGVGVRCFSECLSAPLRPFFLFAPLYTLFLNIPNSLVKNKIVFRIIRIFAHDLMYKEH